MYICIYRERERKRRAAPCGRCGSSAFRALRALQRRPALQPSGRLLPRETRTRSPFASSAVRGGRNRRRSPRAGRAPATRQTNDILIKRDGSRKFRLRFSNNYAIFAEASPNAPAAITPTLTHVPGAHLLGIGAVAVYLKVRPRLERHGAGVELGQHPRRARHRVGVVGDGRGSDKYQAGAHLGCDVPRAGVRLRGAWPERGASRPSCSGCAVRSAFPHLGEPAMCT